MSAAPTGSWTSRPRAAGARRAGTLYNGPVGTGWPRSRESSHRPSPSSTTAPALSARQVRRASRGTVTDAGLRDPAQPARGDRAVPASVCSPAVTGVSGSGKSTLVGEITEDLQGGGRADLRGPAADRPLRAPTWPRTRVCSTWCARSSPPPDEAGSAVTAWAGSPSMCRARRCESLQPGEGFRQRRAAVPAEHGPRRARTLRRGTYNPDTLEVTYREGEHRRGAGPDGGGRGGVLRGTPRRRPQAMAALLDVGLGLTRGSASPRRSCAAARSATHQAGERGCSGGVADRTSLYLLDEPSRNRRSPRPATIEVLMRQLHGPVDAGHTVVVVEHDMNVVARRRPCRSTTSAGAAATRGGRIVAAGTPAEVAGLEGSATAPYPGPGAGRRGSAGEVGSPAHWRSRR